MSVTAGSRTGLLATGAVVVVLLAAMALDTRIVRIGSGEDTAPGMFSAATYGRTEFPKVAAEVTQRAVDAATLAAALKTDEAAAEKRYGVATDAGAELPVKLTGVVGHGDDSGVYDVAVTGLPPGIHVSVQTGPAIVGTDLRDATGTITFGQFTNQIEYQNAGAALNREMKHDVLSKLDTSHLTGKSVSIVGVFPSDDPGNWVLTPVSLSVR